MNSTAHYGTSTTRKRLLATLLVAPLTLGGCAQTMKDPGPLPSMGNVFRQTRAKFRRDNPNNGIERIHLKKPAISIAKLTSPINPKLRARPVDYRFTDDPPTIDDLVQALAADGIQVAIENDAGDDRTSFDTQTFQAHTQDSGKSLAAMLASQTDPNEPGQHPALARPNLTPVSFPRRAPIGLSRPGAHKGLTSLRLPFVRYKGTLGGLMDSLETAGLVAYQQGDMIVLDDKSRYAVTVPQNDDIVRSIAQTLHDLGARDIVTSVDGGKIIYSASPEIEKETIAPFLRKAMRNLSTISIQIAVVSLAINDKSGQGFDWSQFSASLNQAGILANNAYSGGSLLSSNGLGTTGVGGAFNSAVSSPALIPGASVATTSQALNLAATIGTGKILGVATLTSVAGAIQYLSTFGNTRVTQDIDLRTLSGRVVKFRSGDEIPYVKGIGIGTLGSSGTLNSNYYNGGSSGSTLGTVQTDTVKTGIEVDMMPRFDSDNDLVVLEMKMELSQLVEFLQLNAGNQFGTLTQPHTSKQELTDILRIRAGQTAIIGGLQADTTSQTGNIPTPLKGSNASGILGAQNQNVQRNALFIVLRPTVITYDFDGDAEPVRKTTHRPHHKPGHRPVAAHPISALTKPKTRS